MDSTQVLTYNPSIDMILFLVMGLVAVGFIVNSIINFNEFNNIGKLLFFNVIYSTYRVSNIRRRFWILG